MVRVVDTKGRKKIHHVKINDNTLDYIAGRMSDYLYAPLVRSLNVYLNDATSKKISKDFTGEENIRKILSWALEDIDHLIKEKESKK